MILAAWLLCLSPVTAFAGLVQELLTPNYVALIVLHCKRAVLDCDRAEYFGVNRGTGASIHLYGRTMVSGSAGNWLGYQFKSGDVGYFIYVDGDSARMDVIQGSKILAEESGSLTTHGGFE